MPFTPPSRADILERVKADFRTEVGVDPLRRSVEYGLSRALVGQSKGLYGYLTYIFRQCFPDTAETFWFWRWAAIFGIFQKAATPWQGTYTFSGTPTTVVPATTQLTRSDGASYTVDANVTIGGGGTVVGNLTGALGGASGNNDPGQPLTLATPISGVTDAGTVIATTHTGADIEAQQDGLVRLLDRLQHPPSGGGPGDYVAWALSVDGVTRAWEFPLLEGPNEVSVAFVRDNDGTGAAILPDSTERQAVLDYINSVRPITVTVQIITLTALVIDVTISNLIPDTSAVRAAIGLSLSDFFAREAGPGVTLALSRIDAAISEADGETSHTLVAPAAAVPVSTTQVPVLGTVTFV